MTVALERKLMEEWIGKYKEELSGLDGWTDRVEEKENWSGRKWIMIFARSHMCVFVKDGEDLSLIHI